MSYNLSENSLHLFSTRINRLETIKDKILCSDLPFELKISKLERIKSLESKI